MPRFYHAIGIVIEADNYEASAEIANDISVGLACEGEDAFTPAYEHDDEGQRVLYLPPEGEPEPVNEEVE